MRFGSTAARLLFAGFLSGPGFPARATDFVEGEVLVSFKPHVATEAAGRALGRHSLAMDRRFRRITGAQRRVVALARDRGRSTARLIEQLRGDQDVDTVEPNYVRRIAALPPDDADFSKLWGLHNAGQVVNEVAGANGVDTGFSAAWKLARPDGPEVVVAVLDTGIDRTHPDLAANIWVNRLEIPGNGLDDDGNEYRDDVSGYDFVSGTAAVTDSGMHGTHVAGIIAAVGRNGMGVIGVHYRAKILPLKVSADAESMSTSAILEAYDYAIDLKQRGVNIVAINASFGASTRSTAEEQAIQALDEAGIVLCAAAGNGGTNNDSRRLYPAGYPGANIISVAALTPQDELAGFSNYGATSVDLAAPGLNIYSTVPVSGVNPTASLNVGTIAYEAAVIDHSGETPTAGLTKVIHHCGLGFPGDFPAGVDGNIALIQRGSLTFAQKLTNAAASGAVAAIIYDNTPAAPGSGWTLGSSGPWIPVIQVTMVTGQALVARAPAAATVTACRDPLRAYQFEFGTSMAAPYVSGAVAFAALNFPAETISQRIARILTNVTLVPALAGRTVTGGRLNLLSMVDTDHDSLPDWWEREYFDGLAAAPGDDPDRDGSSNAGEFLALTNPADTASHLVISAIAVTGDGPDRRVALEFPAAPDRAYQIEWSSDFRPGTWLPLGGIIRGDGESVRFMDPDALSAAASSRFYRLRILNE